MNEEQLEAEAQAQAQATTNQKQEAIMNDTQNSSDNSQDTAEVEVENNSSNTAVVTQEVDDLFEDTSEVAEIVQQKESDPENVTVLADPDDATKVAVASGAEFSEMNEDDMYGLMDTDEDIRDTLTLPNGAYIIEISPVDVRGKGVRYTHKIVNGKTVPHKPKSIGFSCHVVYDIKNKDMIDAYVYQTHHLLRKDGTAYEQGMTGYKQFCWYATAAALDITYEDVIKGVNPKVVPLRVFNEKAATSDDAPIYMQVNIIEHPPKDGYQAQNEIVHTTMKSDYGLYQKLLDASVG